MKKLYHIIFLLLLAFTGYGQVFQSMPQYGYGPVKRFWVDSTLLIPTICGTPSLKTYVSKQAAIAFDSCNGRFYYYNPKKLTWDTIKGGTGSLDTTSLSNRINAKVDSVKRSTDSVYFYKNGTKYLAFRDSVQNGIWGNDTAMVILAKVHNDAGSVLLRGEVVVLTGANGDVASVKRANNKADSTSANTFGIVKDSISVNGLGWIVTQGQISKINTSAFNEGDIIYLDSISGQFTKSKPKAPNHLVYLGVIERSNAGNGLIYVKPQNGYELDEIHDVLISSKVNNQILAYSDTQKVWKNRNIYAVMDTAAIVSGYVRKGDTAAMLQSYVRKNNTDTVRMGSLELYDDQITSEYTARINAFADQINFSTSYMNPGVWNDIGGFSPGQFNIKDQSTGLYAAIAPTTLSSLRTYILPDADGTVMLRSDSTIYQTKYRTDTMRTNLYASDLTRLKITDTSAMLGSYLRKADTSGKWVNTITRTPGKDSIIFYVGSTRYAIKDSTGGGSSGPAEYDITAGFNLLGSSFKGVNLANPNYFITTQNGLNSGQIYWSSYYLPVAKTITGVKWFQTTKGNYTAGAYNGVALYSYSGGTMTLVASSTNDTSLWKTANSQTWGSKAFSSPYSAAAGIYYVARLYTQTAQTTQPQLGCGPGAYTGSIGTYDFTNSAKLQCFLNSQTSFPATQAMTGVTNDMGQWAIYLY